MSTFARIVRASLIATATLAVPVSANAAGLEVGEGNVIHLTQTGCQFVESEGGVDHGFTPSTKKDCEDINARTGADRLAKSEVLTLKPGTYIFEVENRNVPYELGFWLREKDYDWRNPLHHINKLSVSGGGLMTGDTKRYEIELKPGEYLYSCPLNPTPNYRLVVEG